MRRLIYKKQIKVLLIFLQALAAGGIAFCLVSISFWMEDSFDLAELSRTYEESELFFQQVDQMLSDKIRGQDNERLLETDGEFDRDKQVDIQSYNEAGNAVQDMNTTYLLGDLLDFYENGGWQNLYDALEAARTDSSRSVGEQLDEQAETLETITPVTGITLAECSRWYTDSAGYVEEMYTKLEEVTADLYERYEEYTTVQDESWSSEAPSNLLYYIENTSTGEIYTNTGAESCEEAIAAAMADENYVSLYEGERSFNIVVTNPDRILNTEASEWFLQEQFTDTNEKIYLAVDTSYPVSDDLQTWADYYARREIIVRNAAIGGAAYVVLLVFCFVCSLLGAGQKEKNGPARLLRIDLIPTELAAGIYLIATILYLMVLSEWSGVTHFLPGQEKYQAVAAVASAWLVFLSACLGFVRRLRCGSLWTNSVMRTLIRTWQKVGSSRAASGQLIIFYIGFFVLNFLLLLLFGRSGLLPVVLLDMAVLLYLMRDMAGKQNVYEGIHQLSQGDLKYRIDTSALQGESRKMAEAVNEMGDSLCEALEAIVKNERLKAELITNVSHDLKTPLTSIVNYVDLLKREELPDEKVRGYVEILDQKSQRLKQLTEDLVEASKISSGNIELEIVRIQVQSMLMQACGEFEERFEEHGLHLSWQMEKEPLFILADGRQLWRILENLLGNIVKYAKADTEVQVSLQLCDGERSESKDRMPDHKEASGEAMRRKKAGEVVITLQNVPKEKITVEADELTGRFVRGDASRSTEGSGLGLSIAKNLAELLDGRLELSTEDGLFTASLSFPAAGDESI
ncbi:MAG: HAMP domain-containing histidine kinase [Clostridiales bacterium]|nr:HAMP domain-containing histidine kinase [Clostridiales bacterium]